MNGKTILVVDDTADNRQLAICFLQRGGFSAVGVEGARAALNFLSGHPAPDAIVLDINMPEMSGWDFLEAQRLDPAIADVPVIIYSSEIDIDHRRRATLPPNVVTRVTKWSGSGPLLSAVAQACTRNRSDLARI